MKTAVKYIVSASFLVIGLILIIIGRFSLKNYNDDRFTLSKDFTSLIESTEINNIDISSSISSVEIKTGDKPEIIAKNIDEDYFKCYTQGDTLIIDYNIETHNRGINLDLGYLGSLTRTRSSKIIIVLPKKDYDNLALKNSLGSIDVNDVTVNNMDISNNVGEIKMYNSEAKLNSDIDNNVGSIQIKNSTLENLDIDNDVGSTDIINCTLTGNTSVTTSIGAVVMKLDGDIDDYSIKSDSEMGKIRINGEKGSRISKTAIYVMELESDIGSIKVKFND